MQNILKLMDINRLIFNTDANSYADYVVTQEQYKAQEYEGSSTICDLMEAESLPTMIR